VHFPLSLQMWPHLDEISVNNSSQPIGNEEARVANYLPCLYIFRFFCPLPQSTAVILNLMIKIKDTTDSFRNHWQFLSYFCSLQPYYFRQTHSSATVPLSLLQTGCASTFHPSTLRACMYFPLCNFCNYYIPNVDSMVLWFL
jgi:hypothetical protein